jgi:hypothetical protein
MSKVWLGLAGLLLVIGSWPVSAQHAGLDLAPLERLVLSKPGNDVAPGPTQHRRQLPSRPVAARRFSLCPPR